MASLPISTAPVLSSFCQHRRGLVEDLRRVRLRAPRGRLARESQQILGAERNALQRAAEALALELVVHLLRARGRRLRVSGSASAL